MAVRRGDPCTIEEDGERCGKPVVGRGWCSKHYAVWRKHGDPLHQTRRYVRQGAICAHEGCPEKPKRRGLCEMHAKREVNHGETTDPRERRFWAQVNRRGPDECWPWTGHCQRNGYGQYGTKGERLAHRIAYGYLVGPIPKGLVLDHVCHTREPACADTTACAHRRCCNPAHLEPVTRRENIARGRGGDSWGYVPDPIPVKPTVEKPTTCTNEDCDRPVYKRTICRPCYKKWLRDPDVVRPRSLTAEQRFWMKVDKHGPTPDHKPEIGPCWVWTASVSRSTGYGRFGVSHGNMMEAHRYSYLLTHGSIPDGYDVHHVCHVRSCVRIDHLRATTRSENMAERKVRRQP